MTRVGRRYLLITFGLAALSAATASGEQATTCTVALRPAACLQTTDAVASCASALQGNPSDVGARLSLCEAHLRKLELVEAMVVLRRGSEICGGSGIACAYLRVALSNVQELASRRSPNAQAERDRQAKVDRGYCLGPTSGDAAIKACKSALVTRAEDPPVYEALAAKLLVRRRPGEAAAALQGAIRAGGERDRLGPLLQNAQTQRIALANACVAGKVLADCDDALLAGELDEISIQLRRGELLRAIGKNAAALQGYMAAQSRDPRNKEVARGVLDLIEAERQLAPRDVSLLAAQGDAYYAVGQLNPALESYRSAFESGLDDDAVRARMSAAREARSARVANDCLEGTNPAPCNDLLLAGEADESDIRAHIAQLSRPRNEGQTPARPNVADAGNQAGRDVAPIIETEAVAVVTPRPAERTQESPLLEAKGSGESAAEIRYSNLTSIEGTTH